MKFLITGAGGQLGAEFLRVWQGAPSKELGDKSNDPALYALCSSLIALDKKSLDISDPNSVSEALSYYKPDVVINCAAYNFVDEAEKHFDIAYKVNALGPKNLAAVCGKNNILLVHYGTDYVFDGEKGDFYTEQDEPRPINNYGKSKLEGERFLREQTDNFLLFRVSWVFGEGKQNFFYKLKQWITTQNVVKIACDQISVPTFTEDIVKITISAMHEEIRGVYHLTNSGYASRYEAARYFIERLGLANLLLPVSSEFFPSPAKRPYFSAMSNAKLSGILGFSIPDWKDGVDRFIKRGIL
jgi:dTDP-4-dehydrorhamnose reductase